MAERDRGQAHTAPLGCRSRQERSRPLRDHRVLRRLRVGDEELEPARDRAVRREAGWAVGRTDSVHRPRHHRRSLLREEASMSGITVKNFDEPDEKRTPEKATMDVVAL